MIIADLLAHIGFEVDEKPLHKVEEALEGIKHGLEFFAAAEIVKKLFEVSEQFAHWGEELKVTAESVGLTVESLQQLQFAAEQSGVSAETMTHSMALLSRHLYDAKNGSKEASLAFSRIGISSAQIAGFKNAEDALFAIADKIQGIEDPIKRLAVSQELLGRGGYKMVAFLAKGSAALRQQKEDAQKLGLVLSGPQVEALEETEHAFQRLHAVMRAFGASIAAQIGPVFSMLVDKFIKFYLVNKDIINANIHKWLRTLAWTLGFVYGFVTGLIEKFLKLAKALHLEKDILPTIAKVAGLVSGFLALGAALKMVSIAFGFISPAIAFGAVIGGVIVAVHDLWALFNKQPTWTGSFLDKASTFLESLKDKIKNFDLGKVENTIKDWVSNFIDSFGQALSGLFDDTKKLSPMAKAIKTILEDVLILGGFAAEMGMAIGKGIVEAIEAVLRKSSPTLANFLFGTTEEEKAKQEGAAQTDAKIEEVKNVEIPSNTTGFDAGGDVALGSEIAKAVKGWFGGGSSKSAEPLAPVTTMMEKVSSPLPLATTAAAAMPGIASGSSASTVNVVTNNVHAPVAINNVQNGDPKKIMDHIEKHGKETWGKTLRETGRSVQSPVKQ